LSCGSGAFYEAMLVKREADEFERKKKAEQEQEVFDRENNYYIEEKEGE